MIIKSLKQHRKLTQPALCGLLIGLAGCQTFSTPWRKADLAANDPTVSTISNPASIDNVKGPLERSLMGSQSLSIVNSAALTNSPDFAEYQDAKKLYDAGDYSAAEARFKHLAERLATDDTGNYRKRSFKNFYKPLSERKSNYTDRPIREDSLFMLAESRYAQEEFPGAEDVYLGLLKEYPNTRHLDVATQRLYDIALTWMKFKQTKSSEVSLAAYSDRDGYGHPKVVDNTDYDRPSFFNFTDGSRPKTDTEGRALEALKAIWLNDPTGPLADDALMLTASHYLRIGRNAEAAETYRLLRQEFPDSPHLKDAYLLGAYVTQASYQGAAYDSQNLDEARQLKLMAMNMFPELNESEKERLESELNQVDDAHVSRYFERAIFYLRKGNFEAVEMMCHYIINNYPSSKYSGKARGLLARLPEFRNQNTLVLALQGITSDQIEPIDSLPATTAPVMPSPASPPSTPEPAPEAEPEPAKPKLLPSWSIPRLKPIPIPGFSAPKEEPAPEAPPYESSPGEQPAPGRVQMTLGQQPSPSQ